MNTITKAMVAATVATVSLSALAADFDPQLSDKDIVTCESKAGINRYAFEGVVGKDCYRGHLPGGFKVLERDDIIAKIHMYTATGALDAGGPVWTISTYIQE